MKHQLKIQINNKRFKCLKPAIYPLLDLAEMRYGECVRCQKNIKCCIDADSLKKSASFNL